MKKLLIILIIIVLINLGISLVLIKKVNGVEVTNTKNVDSIINKVQIDSIELVITKKDCTIVNIKNTIKNEINEANNLSDSASLELFEQLVTE